MLLNYIFKSIIRVAQTSVLFEITVHMTEITEDILINQSKLTILIRAIIVMH